MKFKFAALAGCSIATLLASAPATAQEAGEEIIVTGARIWGAHALGLQGLAVDAEAMTQDSALATHDETAPILVSYALAVVTPLTLHEDASDASTAFAWSDLYAVASSSGAPLTETLRAPELASAIDETAAMHQRVSLDQQGGELTDRDAGGGAGWLSEIRLGVLTQDKGPITDDVESGASVNFEVLFDSPRALSSIGSPRPHIGVSVATDPDSTSYAYAGLTWEHDFQSDWFLVGGLGLAVHNGEYLRKSEQPLELRRVQKALGCRVDFHWGIGAGRRLSRHWNLAFHYEHVSSADVCIQGALGLENVGFRVGRVF